MVIYEVVIVCPRPRCPEGMSERVYAMRLEKLGYLYRAEWEVLPRTLRTTFRIESDGALVYVNGEMRREKDATWAIECALRSWRGEMGILVGEPTGDLLWHRLRISVRPAPRL